MRVYLFAFLILCLCGLGVSRFAFKLTASLPLQIETVDGDLQARLSPTLQERLKDSAYDVLFVETLPSSDLSGRVLIGPRDWSDVPFRPKPERHKGILTLPDNTYLFIVLRPIDRSDYWSGNYDVIASHALALDEFYSVRNIIQAQINTLTQP
jgi:hypothetical protein